MTMSTRRDVTGPNAHRSKGDSDSERTERRAQAYELRLAGYTLQQIGDRLGVAKTTVLNDLKLEHSERLDPLKDQFLQYELDRLDRYRLVALTLVENPGTVVVDAKGDTHVVYDHDKVVKGLDRLIKLSESFRKLVGLDAPVRVTGDIQVTETTQEDLELQEMLREAKAKAEAAKARLADEAEVSEP